MTVDLHINIVRGPYERQQTYCSLPPDWCDHEARMEFTRNRRNLAFFSLKIKEIFSRFRQEVRHLPGPCDASGRG
jgi:hypothetical protein